MKKTLALVGLLAIAGLGVGVLTGCHKDEPVDPDPGTVDNDGPEECDHDWVETSHVDAECLKEGSVTYTCSVCGETETLTVPALGHKWSEAVYVAASETPQVNAHWERTCERCYAVEEIDPSSEDGFPEDTVFAATTQDEVGSLASVNGATIALAGTVAEGEETPFTFSEALTVSGENVTFVVGEGSAVTTGESTEITSSALISVSDGASLTLELGEDASFSGSAGEASGTTYIGLIDVGTGAELTINGEEGSAVTQTYSAAPVLTVASGGKCTINGGDFSVDECSNYTVVNDGDLTINGGVFSTENDGSSLIISGDEHNTTKANEEPPVLTINGGVFQGGKHIVKNALEGTLTINGGHFDGYKSNDKTSEDLIDNDTGTTVIAGGVFGQDLTEAEELEYGSYAHVITAKASSVEGYSNTVLITGGTFYSGTEGLFDIADNQSITVSSSVYSEIKEHISEESFNVTNAGSIVLISPKTTQETKA